MEFAYGLLDRGLVPDFILRPAIRALCRQRLCEVDHGNLEKNHAAKMAFVEELSATPAIAEQTERANEQHYEVSTEFMMSCLGPFAKYSCCFFPTGKETLEEAEILMLEDYCKKAGLMDGMEVLDLGCGWGSLSLFLGQKYPKSRITGLSNSSTQRVYIESAAKQRALNNIEIITGDVNVFEFPDGKRFDRILSIEMFEHMKNYEKLLEKIASWLKPKAEAFSGQPASLFVHIFCHKTTPYHFVESDGWMAQMFFSGGTMPSHDLLLYFTRDLIPVKSWYISGEHYSRTAEAWLNKQDSNRRKAIQDLENDADAKGLGREHGRRVFYRFRVFYLAVSEFFGMYGGNEWGVGHYLFTKRE